MKVSKQTKFQQQKLEKYAANIQISVGKLQLAIYDAIFSMYLFVQCDKKIFVENHQKIKLYQAKSVTTSSSQGKQTY